jgi:hypothetical protein
MRIFRFELIQLPNFDWLWTHRNFEHFAVEITSSGSESDDDRIKPPLRNSKLSHEFASSIFTTFPLQTFQFSDKFRFRLNGSEGSNNLNILRHFPTFLAREAEKHLLTWTCFDSWRKLIFTLTSIGFLPRTTKILDTFWCFCLRLLKSSRQTSS